MEFLADPYAGLPPDDHDDPSATHFNDSSSSSGGETNSSADDHSSPAYSASSHQDWALDLGLAMPWSPSGCGGVGRGASPFGAGLRAVPRAGSSAPSPRAEGKEDPSAFGMGGDFWSASPAPSNVEEGAASAASSGRDYFGRAAGGAGKEEKATPMDFEDMVHEGQCGPSLSTSSSPANHPSAVPTHLAALPPSSSSAVADSVYPSYAPHPAPPPHHNGLNGFASHPHPQPQQAADNRPPGPPSMLVSSIAPSLAGGLSHAQQPQQAPSPSSTFAPADEAPHSLSMFASSASNPLPPAQPQQQPLQATRSSSRQRRPTSRDPSLSRSQHQLPSTLPPLPSLHTARNSLSLSQGGKPLLTPSGSVNLVARDAVQAAQLIPGLVKPAPGRGGEGGGAGGGAGGVGGGGMQLLVLGVPTVGAKSRVETQIKISLALVRPLTSPTSSSSSSSPSSSSSAEASAYVQEDGGLDPRAGKEFERVGSWRYLRLPRFLALKAAKEGKSDGRGGGGKGGKGDGGKGGKGEGGGKGRKREEAKVDPPPEQTLSVSVSVVSATDPSLEVFICPNCQQRELKRSLRKKDTKGKTYVAPLPPADPNAPPKNEEEEKRKVVVFNAAEYVEFESGECVIPTRVTCYCRHHKEKKGFCVTYTLRDHLGIIVAHGATPPIMITDDHKTNPNKPADLSSASSVPPPSTSFKRKAPAASLTSSITPTASTTKTKKAPLTAAPSPSSTLSAPGRPRRAAAGSRPSRRGVSATESEEEQQEAPASKKSRPYDAESRPARKRKSSVGSAHRSPTFAMTPLAVSPGVGGAGGLPTGLVVDSMPPMPMQQVASPPASLSGGGGRGFSSALGLTGGMEDAVMSNGEAAAGGLTSPTSVFPLGSRSGSVDLSSGAFDFRAMSTPPLSPGSNAPSAAETFHSLFSGFPSPNPTIVEPGPAPPLSQPSLSQHSLSSQPPLSQYAETPFPSFAIPAVEPDQLPISLSQPNWSLLQQQLSRPSIPALPPPPPPRITRIIPGEGPVSGGIEVTVLGEHFVRDLVCVFGDFPAHPTHFWSSNTLVCVLPPSANPGPVVVGIKGVPLQVDQGSGGLQLFTYKDDSDRSLLELALQVVGLKMTGKLENASAIAMRIVGNSPNGGGQGGGGMGASPSSAAAGGPTDTASLAATLNAAASSVYATPAASRAGSRRSSVDVSSSSPTSSTLSLPGTVSISTETRNFQDIVIKFLSLLDLDPSLIPGSAPSLPSSHPPISHANTTQGHTLLHLATVLGFHRLVAFLLAREIALDAQDRNGNTALHFAALYGRVAIARLLLDAGARVGARNKAGRTAMEIARERDDVDVEELLRARMAAMATPTAGAAGSGRRLLGAGVSPPQLQQERVLYPVRRASVVELEESEEEWSEEEEEEEEEEEDRELAYDGEEYSSAVSLTASQIDDERWDDSSSCSSEFEDDEERRSTESGDEADESAVEAAVYSRPARSRQPSRNPSTVSLHYLLEAETEAEESRERGVEERLSPRLRKAQLVDDDKTPPASPAVQAATSLSSTPSFNHLASASSAWFSQKLKPSVQPSLNKLQGVADLLKEAKAANRFALPQMQLPQMPQMPEITAFHAMPAALSRRMSSTSALTGGGKRRVRSKSEQPASSSTGEVGEEEESVVDDEGAESTVSSAYGRDWRAPFVGAGVGHWWGKAPSSPPPQYTPTPMEQQLASPPSDKKEPIPSPSSPSPSGSTSALSTSPSPSLLSSRASSSSSTVVTRTRLRRRTSAASYTSDADSDFSSQHEHPGQVGIRQDSMLLFFWAPLLCLVLFFTIKEWSTYISPVIETLADTVLPPWIARLLGA
ncbi:hypothetical protein JCM8547_006321 [Rhodosporidiobolus lusitaniae]